MTDPRTIAGIYLHWPYCERKCPYCDFVSQAIDNPPAADYADAVIREFQSRKDELEPTRVVSVYFGGGTPSLMPPADMARILDSLATHAPLENCEITIEANPSSALSAFLVDARQAGINRLSIGVQSTNDEILHFLGRIHDRKQAIAALKAARLAGFDNISVDLILATQPSTVAHVERDLDLLLAHEPEHLSAYCLTIEPETAFGQRATRGEILATDDDQALLQLDYLRRRLADAGYDHYEISNYAKPGLRAVHNSLYWSGSPYLGLGPGAHSYWMDAAGRHHRRENERDPARWLGRMKANQDAAGFVEILSADNLALECIITGLRLLDGLTGREFENRTGQNLIERFGVAIDKTVAAGWCEVAADPTGDVLLRLTPQGLDLAESVFLEFSMVLD
jgi:oxygen-independent coproporphyrinogen-3 oxidase